MTASEHLPGHADNHASGGADALPTDAITEDMLAGFTGSFAALNEAPSTGSTNDWSQDQTLTDGAHWYDSEYPTDADHLTRKGYVDSAAGEAESNANTYTDDSISGQDFSNHAMLDESETVTGAWTFNNTINASTYGWQLYSGAFIQHSGPLTSTVCWETSVEGDSEFRARLTAEGKLYLGNGSVPFGNAYWERGADAHTINTPGNLSVGGNTVLGNSAADSVGMYGDSGAVQAAAISDATGGVVIDAEARAAINALLAAARTSTGIAMIAG